MIFDRAFIRAAVKTMLEHPEIFDDWTVQGFGMMRCYIPGPVYNKQFRLNIWDGALTVPGVSIIHDHPWDFKSLIVNGEFENVRYVEDYYNGDPHNCMTIVTGEVGGPVGLSGMANLRVSSHEHYKTGDTYQQEAKEVHASYPADGAVTLNERTRVGDGEHARVFWPVGTEWGDAIPRKATPVEIERTTRLALEKWE
jgi:hypothetical protein